MIVGNAALGDGLEVTNAESGRQSYTGAYSLRAALGEVSETNLLVPHPRPWCQSSSKYCQRNMQMLVWDTISQNQGGCDLTASGGLTWQSHSTNVGFFIA